MLPGQMVPGQLEFVLGVSKNQKSGYIPEIIPDIEFVWGGGCAKSYSLLTQLGLC